MERCTGLNFNNNLEVGFTYIYLSGLITFFLGVLFLYKKEEKKYLLYFSYFWIFAVLSTFSNILYYHFNDNIFLFLRSVMHLFEGLYLIKAVHKYFERNTKDIWSNYLKVIAIIVSLGLLFNNRFFILGPSLIYLSFTFLKSAKLLFDLSFNEISIFTSVITALFGIHLLLFPYLKMINGFNNYGLFIKGLLGLIFGISIFAIYYEDLQYKLKIREEQYHKLFDQSPAGMLMIDKYGKIIKVNNSITDYTGYRKEELEGESMFKNLVPIKFKIRAQENIDDILNGQDKEYIMETFDKNNNKRFFLMKETKFTLPNYRNCVLSMRIDYTDYKKQQQKIKYLSYHDNLTDLYNRTFMEEEMKRLDSSRQLPISLIILDVNGLKLFNDTYGHQKGDQLLIKTAEILNKSTRSEDIVARWAGDEFVILLPKTGKKEMKKIITRIENNFKQTEDEEIVISAAVGAAVKEKPAENLSDIFNQADEKMYNHKMSCSRKAKKKLMDNMLNNLAAKSCENKDHLQRMKRTAAEFADYIKLKDDEKEKLKFLAELHDLGKISVAEEILKKEDKLNRQEWEKIKEHSEQGYKIAAASKEFAFIAKEILHHHEFWDGSGYPSSLEKDEIPLLSRILAIIDAYDIMRNKNIYSKKLSKKDAISELKRCSGSQFDPVLTSKFIQFLE